MPDIFDNWTTQVRKGILELTVLTALADKDCYAYDLVKSITQIPGLGISEGTIYPLLSRLKIQGLVATRLEESPEGPARKYYTLTTEGRQTLRLMEQYLDSILKGVQTLRDRKGEE
jgi:PadR family transcriptional regulator, regulatory protein PadR